MPAPVFPITIDKRAPRPVVIVIVGPDYSGAAFLLEVRQNPGDTGTPLLSLANASAGAQGISAAFDPAYQFEVKGVVVTAPATIITVTVSETTAESLSLGTPAKAPVHLHYDLHTTPSGGSKFVSLRGPFYVDPGVTIG